MKEKELNKAAAFGLFWNFIQLAISKGFDFFLKLVLAKLLMPEDFGILGMAVVFLAFIQVINEFGFSAALIQKKESTLKESHFNSVFWANIAWSIFLYLIIVFIITPFSVSFYSQEALSDIFPVLAIGVLLNPITLIHHAKLIRELKFKKLTFISNSSSIIAGIIAILLAYYGFGIWALVLNSIFKYALSIPLYYLATKWKPKFSFDLQSFKEVFGFGVKVTGSNLLSTFTNNLDYLIIGKLLSATALGLYYLAFALTDTFRHQIMKVINSVMFPVYSKKTDDLDSIKKYYLLVVKYNSLVVFPIMLYFIIFGDAFLEYFFGGKWSESYMPLKYLSLSVIVHLFVNNITPLLRGVGKPGLEVKNQFIKTAIYLPIIFIGTYYFGLLGASVAILVNKIILVIIDFYYVRKIFHLKFSEIIKSLKIPLLALFITAIVSFAYKHFEFHFIVNSILLFLIYGILVYIFMKKELYSLYVKFKFKK